MASHKTEYKVGFRACIAVLRRHWIFLMSPVTGRAKCPFVVLNALLGTPLSRTRTPCRRTNLWSASVTCAAAVTTYHKVRLWPQSLRDSLSAAKRRLRIRIIDFVTVGVWPTHLWLVVTLRLTFSSVPNSSELTHLSGAVSFLPTCSERCQVLEDDSITIFS